MFRLKQTSWSHPLFHSVTCCEKRNARQADIFFTHAFIVQVFELLWGFFWEGWGGKVHDPSSPGPQVV